MSRILFCCCLLLSLITACSAPQNQASSGDQIATYSIDGQGKTGISGQVRLKESGTPLAGAYINVYPNTISNLLGPSQFLSAPTGANGRYQLELPPGNYYVVSRQRASGQANGPLATGDYYSDHQRILAQVKSGRLTQVDLNMVKMKAPMFFKKDQSLVQTTTGIKGILLDTQGRPVAGGFAIAYRNDDLQRLPDYASTLSNQQGEFTLYLPEGGEYYLAARIHAWDMPRPGELYGKYGGRIARSLKVKTDTFATGVEIHMAPFNGVYKESNNQRPF